MQMLLLDNAMGYADCKNQTYSLCDSFTRASFRLFAGKVYGIVSPFGLGSWGLTNCIGGAGTLIDGTILLDGKPVNQEGLREKSCFISESASEAELSEHLTVRQMIGESLKESGLSYTEQDIKSFFSLSDERFERPIAQISGEIRQVSAAVGFARGKEIFCYPWLISNQIDRYLFPQTLSFLREEKKLVLIPTDPERKIAPYCDGIIKLSNRYEWKCPRSLRL